jgi:para-nitrobenzyl esterase
MTDTAAPHAVRSWLGIPYATAGRFRRPALLPFDPDLPYDQKGPAPLQAGDTSWLEADNGFSQRVDGIAFLPYRRFWKFRCPTGLP